MENNSCHVAGFIIEYVVRDDMVLKEVGRSRTPFLFGKYQLCRVIGKGESGTVFLAVHRELEEYRAIKRVPKTAVEHERFRREALILKDLRHPGIPIVYDLEEDEQFSYLIEEFLEGVTLSALIQQQGPLSTAMTIRYGIQICHLVYCLHSAKPSPILYLDLQPKNLLLCQDTIKLVDFNHAATITEANLSRKRYGTVGCAAPEQYTGEALDERTDLYAIGAILYFLLTGTYPEKQPAFCEKDWGEGLTEIIRTCLHPDKEKRFESVSALCKELEQLNSSGKGVFTERPSSSLTIALVGSRAGIGTTHLAIGLSVYLTRQGYSTIYEEKNHTRAVQTMAGYFHKKPDFHGVFLIRGLPMKPDYGKNVRLEEPDCQIKVADFGTDLEAALAVRPEAVLFVCGGKWWNQEEPFAFSEKAGRCGIQICNQCVDPDVRKESSGLACPVFEDPFIQDPKAFRFYEMVCQKIRIKTGQEKGGLRRKLRGVLSKF